jgi:hypothetical protein
VRWADLRLVVLSNNALSELTESDNHFFELGYRAVIKVRGALVRLLRTGALLLLSSWARDRLNQGAGSCVHSSESLTSCQSKARHAEAPELLWFAEAALPAREAPSTGVC